MVGLNLAVVASLAFFVSDHNSQNQRAAWKNAENLSKALDAGLTGTFSQVNIVLQTVADEYQRELGAGGVDPVRLQAMLDHQATMLPGLAGIRVADANGDVRYASNVSIDKPINIRDRAYFQELRGDPNSSLMFSKPEFGRIINKWIVVLARRLTAPNGVFAGTIHISLPTEELERIFSTLDIGPHGIVALWNRDGALIARIPSLTRSDGTLSSSAAPSAELQQLLSEGRDNVAYRTGSGTDKVERALYLRRIGQFPLHVVVGLADEDYSADGRRIAEILSALYALFLAASVVGGLLIYFRAAARAKSDAQSRLAATVYDSSSEGMAIIGGSQSIVDVNSSFCGLTGLSAEEARGQKIGRQVSVRRNPGHFAAAARAVRANGHWSGEFWVNRTGAEPFLARVSVSSVSDNAMTEDANCVVLIADDTEQKRAQELIWRHANIDALTNLPNRRHFGDAIRAAIASAEARHARIAVLFVDLDRFKEVNDSRGHTFGDALLQEVARRVGTFARSGDLVARLGGDEFTLMLRQIDDVNEIDQVAERLVAMLSQPYKIEGDQVFTSASVGVTFYPDDATDFETLLRNADQAMYAAKWAGGNRFHAFTPEIQIAMATRASLSSDLHLALAKNEISIHYQPIVDLDTSRVIKAEALARWRHPTRGDVSPSEFIPIAEETGLIVEIGEWIFRQAAMQATRWRQTLDPRFQISVNVSAVQLMASEGVARFEALARQLDLGPGAMIVEITESALIDRAETVRDCLARLRAAGVEIALDDFGTGYSSLAYLKEFDINYLKMDRAFVSGLAENPRDYAVCEAVVAMAHKMGMKVIAEGVETEAQRDLLATAGCDHAQGFLYSRPVPAADFECLLAGKRAGAAGLLERSLASL